MRRYPQEAEERIRAQALVREWQRSRCLQAEQSARLEAELRVDLRRTNPLFRLVLFVFTLIIVGSSLLMIVEGFGLEDELPVAVLTSVAAVVCFLLAEYLVTAFRFYRFGIEEALAVAAVVLVVIAAVASASLAWTLGPSEIPGLIALSVGALGAFGIYLRFGYVYAAVAAMICAAAVPFQTALPPEIARAAAAAIFAAVFIGVRPRRLQHGDEFPGDDYGVIQSAAWAGLYLVLNFMITFSSYEGRLYWWSYAATWVVPVLGLRMGLRDKDRALVDVNIAMALVTLVTNKAFLGLPRQAWDPILFGIFLMAIAITTRRWLAKGTGGERHGYTPKRLLAGDRRLLALAGTASVVMQTGTHQPHSDPGPVKPEFGGGRSGGAGASGEF